MNQETQQKNDLGLTIPSINISSVLEKIIMGGIIFILALPLLGDYGNVLFPIGRDVIFKLAVELIWILFLLKILIKKSEARSTKSETISNDQNSKFKTVSNFRFRISDLLKNPIFLSLSSFWIIILISTLNSVQPEFSIWGNIYKNQGLIIWTHYVLFFFLLITSLRNKNQWRILINTAIFIAMLVSLIALWQILQNGFGSRAAATLNNPNYLAAYLMLLLPVTFSIFLKKPSYFLGIAAILQFLALIATQTRGGYVGIAIAALVFALLYLYSKRYESNYDPKSSITKKQAPNKFKYPIVNHQSSLGIGVLIIGSCLIIVSWLLIILTPQGQRFQQKLPNFTDRFLNKQSILSSAGPRLEAWQAGWGGILEKPLLGYGPENFFVAYDEFYSGSLDHTGSLAMEGSLWESWFDKAHNFIFDIGATTGFLGLFAYMGIFASAIFILSRKLTGSDPVSLGLIAAFTGYLMQNLLGFDTTVPGIYLMFLLGYIHYINSKHEARNSKQYLNSNDKNSKREFRTLEFRILNLFRISDFGFRIFLLIITLVLIPLFILSFNLHLNIFRANYNLNLAESLAQRSQIEQTFATYEKGLGYNALPINPNLRRRYAVIALAYYDAVEKHCLPLDPPPASPELQPASPKTARFAEQARRASRGGRGEQGDNPAGSAAPPAGGASLAPSGRDSDSLNTEQCEKLYKDSEKYLNRALELQKENAAAEWPRFTRNYIYAAQISHILGNYEESDIFFEKALTLSPNRASIYAEWARLLDERGETQKAEKKLKKAHSINPNIKSL